jgi:hypothetical protein
MRKLLLFLLGGWCAAQTTPNLNLYTPPYNASGWNTLINANFSKLDSYLSGGTGLPGSISLSGNLTVGGAITCSSGCGNGTVTGATSGGGLTGTATLGLVTTCSSTQVLEWNGSSWVCATLGGTGLPSTVVYVPSGSNSSYIQSVLSAASSGEEIWFSGNNTGCGLTLTVTGVRIHGLNEYSTTIQCATASSPVLTVSGSGLNGFEMHDITLQHITNSPTCAGGAGTSTCGDGLQVGGGASRVKIEHVHSNFNYNNFALGWTTYSEWINSEAEFGNGDGINFVMSSGSPTMQWQVRGGYSGQNLGAGMNMTCPASFTSVQSTAPTVTGGFTAYGDVGPGIKYSCSAATTSGIADVVLADVLSSTNNASDIYLDLGPSGGRNSTVACKLCELTGQFTGTAGFAQATQSATNVGYGLEITSSCDSTTPPQVLGGVFWQNSYSGVSASCPGTAISEPAAFDNGLATASAQTEAGVTINAASVQVTGGYFKKGTDQSYGIYQLSGDTPSIIGPVCDSATTSCVYAANPPANGYQQQIGTVRILTGSGTPTMNCTAGWTYFNSSPSSSSTVEYVCYPANTWVAVTVP